MARVRSSSGGRRRLSATLERQAGGECGARSAPAEHATVDAGVPFLAEASIGQELAANALERGGGPTVAVYVAALRVG
jgi:hypothetical protein